MAWYFRQCSSLYVAKRTNIFLLETVLLALSVSSRGEMFLPSSTKHRAYVALSLMILVAMVIFEFSNTVAEEFEYRVESVTLTLYRDGLVHVTQIVHVNETVPEITLPLLSFSVTNVLVTDENGTVLDYEIDGSNITVFTLGATKATLEYDTVSLTSMESGVWTLSLKSPYNLTVILPEDAEVIFFNEVPASIDTEGGGITISLFPGMWEISYILPLAPLVDFKVTNLQVVPSEINPGEEVTVSVLVTNIGREAGSYDVALKINGSVEKVETVTLGGGESTKVSFKISKDDPGVYNVEIAGLKGEFRVKKPPSALFPIEYVVYLSIILIIAAIVVLFGWRRRKPSIEKIFENHPHLRQEERDVLTFLAENDGKAFESEIRKRFPEIPRTSLWRLIRRLEKEEIVKIRRVGLENLVELSK